ncbi:hypothetical protein [Bradyrhizobium arachidis]|uniref:Uncharacterized protein n=1 Tax=Bradyrhizobium arachidis TaxID=858423 RepID=A0AAE7NRR2_9BRAD|nr:hypothetical protein [Bradyrhizobium arachidis]QOZ69125.1 hypothetical protein WN72_24500 [Bradyrhizobium arachidis]SFV00937.1 hypothetical protein SAMN05192541_109277 [Bradyrhizobium arachidis]
MSKAMELIVAGYVKAKDRRALSDLLSHRRKVVAQLEAVVGINPARALEAVRDELLIIEAGIEELKPPAGSLPENEYN